MSRPNSAATSSACNTFPAAGPFLVIGNAKPMSASRSFWFTPRRRNSNSGLASRRAPTLSSAVATCLHIEAWSRGVVETIAGEADLRRLREQTATLAANSLHHAVGKAALQQLHQRIDTTRAIGADRFPLRRWHCFDADLDRVERRSADHRPHRVRRDLQVDYQAVAQVAASAFEPVRVIAVALQIVAPCPAPEGGHDPAARHGHRRQDSALLAQPGDRAFGLQTPFGDRHIDWPLIVILTRHSAHSFIAVFRSRATSRIISSFASSVRLSSVPPVSSSSDNSCVVSIKASIFSSIVPRQTNLWTRTFFF